VSAGGDFVCASAATAECWGYNYYGELGDGTTTNSSTPQPVSSLNPLTATTTYAYSTGQLTSTTDANGKTTSYLYGYTSQVVCETYPVSTTTSCGTLSSPATGSPTNTIVNYAYDTASRLHSVKDWLGNATTYAYTTAQAPYTPTTVTYPVTGGLTATYGFDNDGAVTSLSAGSSISDSWTRNSDEQVSVSTINGSTSASTTYNGSHQITGAANLATSTSNDTYTLAANGEITKDVPPSGPTYSYGYNLGAELCTTTAGSSATACGTNPSTGTSYQYTANGQRSSASPYTSGTPGTTTNYGWNSLGELCNTSTIAVTCGVTPANGSNYTYSGDGLRVASSNSTTSGPPTDMLTTTSTTDSTWDLVMGGSIPLNINDATTSSSTPGTTSNTSYIYGDLLFGGTAPVEQISGSNASFLVTNQLGVQGVVSSSGTVQEKAIYSVYGSQTIQSGSKVTPFGFQGSYTDSTGLIYLINRYYDPATDQFISVDPAVALTDQPYVFTNDNPLNATDPLGLKGWYCMNGTSHYFEGNKYGAMGTGKCVIPSASPTPVVKSSSPSRSTAKSGSSTGRVLQTISNVSGTIGLASDAATLADTSTVVLIPADAATVTVTVVTDGVSTATGCAAGFYNDGIGTTATADCINQVAVFSFSDGLLSSSGVAKAYGDGQTLWNDFKSLF
jgi:RHS repeat-associated protein